MKIVFIEETHIALLIMPTMFPRCYFDWQVKQHVAGVGAGGKCRIKSGAADHKWKGAAKNRAI